MSILYDVSPGSLGVGHFSSATRTPLVLDSNFTLGSAGDCVGFRFIAPATTTISYVLFFLSAAPAGAENLSVNACAYGASTTRPGAALTNGTVTVSGGTTANVWIKATFSTPPNITEGEPYWIVIGNPTGAASGYSILQRGTGITPGLTSTFQASYVSADGFATNGSSGNTLCSIVIALANGQFLGNSLTATAVNHTSNQLERGMKFTPDVDTVLVGITHDTMVTPPTTASIKVYEDGQAPGGTVFAGFNGGAALACNDNAAALTAFVCSAVSSTFL